MALLRDASDSTRVLYYGSGTNAYLWLHHPTLDTTSTTYRVQNINSEIFCSGASALGDGRLLVHGGTVPFSYNTGLKHGNIFDINEVVFNDNTYSPQRRGWVRRPDMTDGRYYGTSTTLSDGKALIMSGNKFHYLTQFGGTTSQAMTADLFAYAQYETLLASTLSPGSGPSAREGHTAIYDPSINTNNYQGAAPERRMVMFGGRDSTGPYASVWALYRRYGSGYAEDWSWQQMSPVGTAPSARSGHAAIFRDTDSSMIVFGGKGSNGQPVTDKLWRLYLHRGGANVGKWEQITVSGGPSARYGHTAVYDPGLSGGRLFIFGGRDANGLKNDAWVLTFGYSGTPEWQEVPSGESTPSAREGHSAAYVRDVGMLIFGGYDGTNYLDDTHLLLGTFYIWIDKTTSQKPPGRAWHAMSIDDDHDWSRMVISGGKDASGLRSDLWRARWNNLSSGAFWNQLAVTSAPSARFGHSLIWDDRGTHSVSPERYDPSANTWTTLSTLNRRLAQYPHMYLLPNGKLFYAGADESTRVLDLSTGWSSTVYTSNFDGESSAMYLPGRILKVGPGVGAERIQFASDGSTNGWELLSSMSVSRFDPNLTIVPTGDVLVTGGRSASISGTPRRDPALWKAATGTWSSDTLAADPATRGYHSTALLLPDARILTAGGFPPFDSLAHTGAIYWPPYLFNSLGALATRPRIDITYGYVSYGSSFTVCMLDNASGTTKVCLIRPGSVTHAFNMDQRYIPLDFEIGSGADCRTLTVDEPVNSTTAPPGDYLLFVLKGSVPSVAKWIRVGSTRDEEAPACLGCGGGGMFAGGGGEGGDVVKTDAASKNLGGIFEGQTASAERAWTPEERLAFLPEDGGLGRDVYRLQTSPPQIGGRYVLQLRQGEGTTGSVDRVSLAVVDHPAESRVFAVGGQFVSGRIEPAESAMRGGTDVTRIVTGADWNGLGLSLGDTLVVSLRTSGSESQASTLLYVEHEGSVDRSGMVGVEIQDGTGMWNNVGRFALREGVGESVLSLAVGSAVARLVPTADARIRFIGALVDGSPPSAVASVEPTTALGVAGDVREAVLGSGNGTLELGAGETLRLEFDVQERASVDDRAYFLDVLGISTTPDGSELSNQAEHVRLTSYVFSLGAARPNPSSGEVRLDYSVPQTQRVSVRVYDIAGRFVRSLHNGLAEAGPNTAVWDGRDQAGRRVASGVYFYRMQAGGWHRERKLVMLQR